MNKDQTISAGLTFLRAAQSAVATLGDKERVRGMRDAMQVALRNRFSFADQDAPALASLSIESRAGDFRPLDYYKQACIHGGSYTEMWEAQHQMKPWVARWAVASEQVLHGYFIMEDNRVANGMGVLLPQSVDTPDSDTLSVSGLQVWWVGEMTDDFIRLCRYRLTPEEMANRHRDTPFLHHSRSPFRVRVMMREEWDELNALLAEEKQAA